MNRIVALVLATASLAGCLGASTSTCSDGTTCPAGKACPPAGGGCVDPDQLAACNGQPEGTNCTASAVAIGVCLGGVCDATRWTATTLIGGAPNATTTGFALPQGIAVDPAGNVYVADTGANRIRRLDVGGVVTTLAGTGASGFGGDHGLATSARLDAPQGVAVDGIGNVFIADTENHRIRQVDIHGIITTVAGRADPLDAGGFSGDNGPATSALLEHPNSVAVDGFGNLFVADTGNDRIRLVASDGTITTVAGGGTGGDAVPAVASALAAPAGVAVDAMGNLYIADTGHDKIRKVDHASLDISTFAGGGSGDAGPATSVALRGPRGVAVAPDQAVLIADTESGRICQVDAGGNLTTIAGTGPGIYGGDGGPATSAGLFSPQGVATDSLGSIYIMDTQNERVRRIDMAGVITTIAGHGGAPGDSGDGGAATSALLSNANAVAVDVAGNVYITEQGSHRIRKVDPTGVVTTFAGTGIAGYGGDGGPATSALLSAPSGLAIDTLGGLLVADQANHRIRRIASDGTITTVAGTGQSGFTGDGGAATDAELDVPFGVTIDGAGNLYIADTGNDRIRKVDAAGIITTFAGSTPGFGGDSGPATSASLHAPTSVAIDGDGNLYIVDQLNQRVRRVDASGTITTFAGTGAAGFNGDTAATLAELNNPFGIAVDAAGNVYVADVANARIREIDHAGGQLTTVAGIGPVTSLADGDGSAATSAVLTTPNGVGFDGHGNLYIADNTVVRRVDPAGHITTLAGQVDPDGMGPVAQARLADPTALVLGPSLAFVAGGSSGTVQQLIDQQLEVVAGRYQQATARPMLARFGGIAFGNVGGIAYDASANQLYLTESTASAFDLTQVHANRILVVTIVDPMDASTWTIAPLANTLGTAGFADGVALQAELRAPTGLYFDGAAQQLYVADTGNHVIRAVDLVHGVAGATVRTIAGTPQTLGFFGDGGLASDALLFAPAAVTRCANGDLFVADTGNDRVRRIAAGTGTITTVLGDGSPVSSGEGLPASTFSVDSPLGLACDELGNLFVTSTTAVRMVVADASGVVDGTGPVRTVYGLSHAAFPESVTRCLAGLAVVDATTVRVTDACTGLLIELAREPAP